MRIFCTRIIREKTYRELLKFKKEVGEILKKNLPVVANKTLENKNITLSKGCILINSWIRDSKIDYNSEEPLKAFFSSVVQNCVFFIKGKKNEKAC